MAELFTKLTEEFDSTLINYVDVNSIPIGTRRHIDIRSFIGDDITVPQTMLDLRFNSITSLDGTQMAVLDTPRIVAGRTVAARPLVDFNGKTQTQMDTYTMSDLDVYTLSTGGENWPVDPNVIVGKDSAERYANSIQIVLTSGVTKTVASLFNYDNLYLGFESSSSTYYIELALPGFPAQAAGTHLDLANSFIDFTSDGTGGWDPTKTNSFRFSDSINSLTAGGDTYWQINRNSLTNVDLKNLQGVRFRLKSIGNMTFKAQAFRMYKSDEYAFDMIDRETRRAQFKRSVPRDSGTELSSPTHTTYMMNDTRPKNFVMCAKFNSGTLATSDSQLSLIGRNTDGNNYITGTMLLNSTRTQLSLSQRVAGVNTTLNTITFSPLAPNKFYFLCFEATENQTQVSIFSTDGAFLGGRINTTGYFTTALVQRGRTGFTFLPYNYDFVLDYITPSNAEFGRFESTVFNSITPILGATLATETTAPINLTESHFVAAGDATILNDPTTGDPAPSIKFVRDGTNFTGGYATDTFLFIGNPNYLKIVGDVYPTLAPGATGVRGEFRVVFIDKWDSVGYMTYLRNLLPSQWNHFEIPINDAKLAPGNYRILIQQTGFYNDTFRLDNLAVNHLAFAWSASPDGGTTWYNFLTALEKQFSAVNFKLTPGTQLKIRASALSDDAWLSQYEIVPFYGITGRVNETVSSTLRDVRISGKNSISRTTNVRVQSSIGSSVAFDVRVNGRTVANLAQDVRQTGQATSNRTQDSRITATLGSNIAYNVRQTGTASTAYTVGIRITGI